MWVKLESGQLVKGEPQEYELKLPDGRPKRAKFCSRCSTRLWGTPYKSPALAVLRPGTLDDTSWLYPIGHVWTRSAQPWIHIPDGTLNYSGQPEVAEFAVLVRAWKNRGFA